jgi:multicomponent Na+:H+ antiporter subunit B
MTALWTEVPLGGTAVALGTPLVFDVGVFLAVIGVVVTIVFTLTDVSLSEE